MKKIRSRTAYEQDLERILEAQLLLCEASGSNPEEEPVVEILRRLLGKNAP